jgi:hypothetical protein
VLRVELGVLNCGMAQQISAVATFEFAKAKITGTKPNLGENRKVTVPMR